jgi:hypothetical protein
VDINGINLAFLGNCGQIRRFFPLANAAMCDTIKKNFLEGFGKWTLKCPFIGR